MRKALLLSTALTLGSLTAAQAGGPVVVEEEPAVVAAKPASSGGILIPLLLVAAIVAIASSGGSDEAATNPVSDIRLKRDIRRVGTNHLGLGVYQYRYQGMDGVWEGVMAQEVEVMHASAIRPLPFGYKSVDYARLGLELKRVA